MGHMNRQVLLLAGSTEAAPGDQACGYLDIILEYYPSYPSYSYCDPRYCRLHGDPYVKT